MNLSEYERSRNPRGMHGWGNLWDCYLDAIRADTPEALKEVLDARVRANARCGW